MTTLRETSPHSLDDDGRGVRKKPLARDESISTARRSPLPRYVTVLLATNVAILVLVALLPDSGRGVLLWELGPLQIAQVLVLLAACVVVWRVLREARFNPDERPVAAALFFLLVLLCWREAEPDHMFGLPNAFRWDKYLLRGSNIGLKLGLGIPTLALTAWILAQVLPGLKRTLRLAWQRRSLASPWLLAAGIGLLALSQAWDKGRTPGQKGLGPMNFVASDLPEELLEISGELVLLFCTLEFAREVRARMRSTRRADSPETARAPGAAVPVPHPSRAPLVDPT